MRNSIILAGAAALAISAPLLAQGKGGGGPKGGNGSAKVERGGGGPKGERGGGGDAKAWRGGGPKAEGKRGGGSKSEAKRGGGQQRTERAEARGSERRAAREDREDRRKRAEKRKVQEVRQRSDRKQAESRGLSGERGAGENRDRSARESKVREARGGERQQRGGNVLRPEDRWAYLSSPSFRTTGLINNCPPGLAVRNNGCLPPGQAKKLVGGAVPAALGGALLPDMYRSWYPDDERHLYRTDDGYIYRIDRQRELVDAFFPFAPDYTGAYYVGAAYPDEYADYYNVPVQYRPLYEDSGDSYYRYGDGSIYEVDRQDGLITAIVSLLAGDLAVGQPLPEGYDVYNVPYDYRERYADGPDALYRYNDGAIYEVDPTTRLVQAVVEKLF